MRRTRYVSLLSKQTKLVDLAIRKAGLTSLIKHKGDKIPTFRGGVLRDMPERKTSVFYVVTPIVFNQVKSIVKDWEANNPASSINIEGHVRYDICTFDPKYTVLNKTGAVVSQGRFIHV